MTCSQKNAGWMRDEAMPRVSVYHLHGFCSGMCAKLHFIVIGGTCWTDGDRSQGAYS